MSANLERDRTHLVRWLDECGLSSTEGSVSVTLVTDSEQSVSTFSLGVLVNFTFWFEKRDLKSMNRMVGLKMLLGV